MGFSKKLWHSPWWVFVWFHTRPANRRDSAACVLTQYGFMAYEMIFRFEASLLPHSELPPIAIPFVIFSPSPPPELCSAHPFLSASAKCLHFFSLLELAMLFISSTYANMICEAENVVTCTNMSPSLYADNNATNGRNKG